ncbi:hypothetical protein V491_04117 [Pseudogymnoascus sp. VKM F-3775]|nr:hypothetical protein V491_04117 [Pseudogymnoascus sp. VKM F-3775]
MTSPSSTASSPIRSDAYFVDLYPLASPAHSRSPSPIYHSPAPSTQSQKSNRNQNHNHNNNDKHYPSTHNHNKPYRPPPYRPRLEFAPVPATKAPFRPSLSFLDTAGPSPPGASPLTPESPVEGVEGEKCSCVKKEDEEGGSREDRISAQGLTTARGIENEEASAKSGRAAGVQGEADGEGGGAGKGGGGVEGGVGGFEGEAEGG